MAESDKNSLFRKSSLERLSSPEQLNRYIKIVSPSILFVLVGLIFLTAGGLVWAIGGSIPVTVDVPGVLLNATAGDLLTVQCVLPTDESAKVFPGMDVQVTLDAYSHGTYGYIHAKVKSIGHYPISQAELTQTLGNSELAKLLLNDTPSVATTIELERDPASQNGLKWSNEKGRQIELSSGFMASVLIIVKEQRPIDLVLQGDE